jgi:hypothetical protein
MGLTAKQVKYAKPGKHHDGFGLYLVVTDKSRKWVQRGTINGKRREWGLGGVADDNGLADARDKSAIYRKLIRDGIDPSDDRKRKLALLNDMPTFKQVAMIVYKEHKPTWKNEKDAKHWLSTMERYAFPVLGDIPIDAVTGPTVRDVLAEI